MKRPSFKKKFASDLEIKLKEISNAFANHLQTITHKYSLDDAFKMTIYKDTESEERAKSEILFCDASFLVKRYVETDKFTDELYHMYDNKQIKLLFITEIGFQVKTFSVQVIRLEETAGAREYISPMTGKPMVPIYSVDASANSTEECSGNEHIVITPFINCPHVILDKTSYSWHTNAKGITIEELDLYIDNTMFRRQVDDSSVSVCMNTFLDAVNRTLNYERYQSKAAYSATEGIVSFILNCISVVCLVLTLLTYMLFPVLRTQPGINNMILSVFLIAAYLLLAFGISQSNNVTVCGILGGIIHFCWVLVFFWMNVCSIHMFRVFRSLGRPKSTILYLTLKYLLYSVVTASAVIGINIAVSYYISNGNSYGYGPSEHGMCYIRYPLMVLFTMTIPANIIVASNIFMFFIIALKLRISSKIQKHTQKDRNYFVIYARLSTITGITWLSCIPMILTRSTIFEYIFIVLNCSQGIYIFIAFTCNKRVVSFYKNMFAPAASVTSNNNETHENNLSSRPSQCSSISVGNGQESTEKFDSNLNSFRKDTADSFPSNAGTHMEDSTRRTDTTEVLDTKL